jgi:hypothetical protein
LLRTWLAWAKLSEIALRADLVLLLLFETIKDELPMPLEGVEACFQSIEQRFSLSGFVSRLGHPLDDFFLSGNLLRRHRDVPISLS